MQNMKQLSTLPPLKDVIARHELFTKKGLGQHFLLNEAVTDRIVQYAGEVEHHHVIEIGPGPGGLTRSLLKAGAQKVYVIEKDERCLAIMQELKAVAGGRLEIIHGDALAVDLTQITPRPRKIVANLPYNVGTQMLVNWLEAVAEKGPDTFISMTLMFQKEVAERVCAEQGGKEYGRLSVFAQWLCHARWDMDLPPGAFSPPPKVSSAVITLTPRAKPLVDVDKYSLERVLAAAFNQRRKMLRGSLKTLGIDAEKLLADAGIDGTKRAEQLTVQELGKLAQCLGKINGRRKP